MALTLPQPTVPVFSGDPIHYCDFVRAFEQLIEQKTSSASARLYYLVQYTTGQAQELMKSCLSMSEEMGYGEARRLLKERYGQDYRVAAAHVQRLIDGPLIKTEDGAALQQFSIQLTSCLNTLREIGYVNKLDNPDNLKKIIDRLPYGLRLKWRDTVDRIVEKETRDVTVHDITAFVTARARAATHPIFGKVANQSKGKPPISKPKRDGARGSGFSTQDGTIHSKSQAARPKCPLCKGDHWLSRCDKFRKQSLKERQELIKREKLCINCLSPGHFVRSCSKESFCKVQGCSSKHSTFLHPKTSDGENNQDSRKEPTHDPPSGNSTDAASNGYVKTNYATNASVTALAIAPVRVRAKGKDKTVQTYAFLDSGSNTTFCTDNLLKQLDAEVTNTKLSLTTLEGKNEPVECSTTHLEVFHLSQENRVDLPVVYSRQNLPIPLEAIAKQEDVNHWPNLKGIEIPPLDAEIGLLTGSDVPQALQPMEVRQSESGGPFATRTKLGWVLNGPLRRLKHKIPTTNFLEADRRLDKQFQDFCNLEFSDSIYESKTSMSPNDRKALDIMEQTVKLENGHYEIALPWKNYPPCLQNNKPQAENRLRLLKKRLQREPIVLEKYREFMNGLLKKDYARKVTSQELGPIETQWYLPHHPVFNPQKPGKIRVVFDCSAKYRDTSLNDQLLQGPDLTNSLVGVLTRFRQEPVALMSDIEAMFHQVRVRQSDCDALRFLWWPDGDLDCDAQEYQMMVHLFGGTSSPSCANFALKRTAEDNKEDFDSQTIDTVNRNFYVDDCLKSVGSEDTAIRLANQLRELLARGGFNLTKWLSNSKRVIEALPEANRAAQVRNLDFDKLPVERALGVQWNVSSDQFGFSIGIKDRPATRRGILSVVSSVYDPLGFVAPFTLNAKLFLQDLCRNKYGWDDPISESFLHRWQAWLHDLPNLEKLAINRCFKSPEVGEIALSQLHHFSDASQQGYGAATYLRLEDRSGKVKCSFVMGKSRLAPLKQMTVPRLQLSAAVVAARLETMSRKEISMPISQSFFWTDSTCVLRYIENQERRFQTFVANRVATIHDVSSPQQWSYVNTELNPADDASRGVPVDSLQRWIQGPEFLTQPPEKWPQRPSDMSVDIPEDDPEVKKSSTHFVATAGSNIDAVTQIFERISSWYRLKKFVAWTMRYKQKLKEQCMKRRKGESTTFLTKEKISQLSTQEMRIAEEEIIKYVQRQSFTEEITLNIKKSSPIYKLDPKIENGLLRVGGRLRQAPIEGEAKHPAILPKRNHVVQLIVRHYHESSGHSGQEHVLSLIREKYWIVNARRVIHQLLNSCFDCRRRQAPVGQQKMASLPVDRITPSRPPFTFTGLDCFGPFNVRRGRVHVKRYGVIFTCLSLRSVHIEVANSLDTESFINALRRFISRRGQPEEIRSDNGGNFVRGEKELREAIQQWNQSQIHEFLLQHNVKWVFNPPSGSHHGGAWERCIRTVRKVLKAITREQVLDDEGLHTLMCEVEAIVNGRPITKSSDDPRDLSPLTPNHLLLLRAGPALPPGVLNKDDNCIQRRWRQVQYLADVFWRRWVREYLPSLQERQKWHKQHRNFAVDDIVLVLDDKKPRNAWPLGRIVEVYTNRRDGLVRSVKLKTSTSVLVRPVDKIVLLEAAATSSEDK